MQALLDMVTPLLATMTPLQISSVAVLVSLMPAVIAKIKGRSFIGFWVYGLLVWPVALTHSLVMARAQRAAGAIRAEPTAPAAPVMRPEETKACPDCAATVLAVAGVCQHCGYEFNAATEPATEAQRQLLKRHLGMDAAGLDRDGADRRIAAAAFALATHRTHGGPTPTPAMLLQAVHMLLINNAFARACLDWAGPGPIETVEPAAAPTESDAVRAVRDALGLAMPKR